MLISATMLPDTYRKLRQQMFLTLVARSLIGSVVDVVACRFAAISLIALRCASKVKELKSHLNTI